MKKQLHTVYINLIISFVLGVIIWAFFGIYYRHHLHYQEQLQLFLFNWEYFVEKISRPGGLAVYLANFITQFFYHSSLGALLISFLLVILRTQISMISYDISKKLVYALLTCVPSLLFAILLCDENVHLSGLIAVLFNLYGVIIYKRINSNTARTVYLLIMIPFLYGLFGYAVFTFPALCLFMEWTIIRTYKKSSLLIITIACIAIMALCPFIIKMILPQYPISRFWLAGDYYRLVTINYPFILYVLLSVVIVPLLFKWLPNPKKSKGKIITQILQLLFLFITIDWLFAIAADWEKEELMGYDYYVRTEKWNNIIDKANKRSPDSPQTVAALNLALSKKDYLGDYMFYYFQNGADGLIPNHTVDFILPLMIGETYYHMGLVNSAQRFIFEGMESIPDYQKSSRCLQRLAETNLINGNYEVAEKYLRILQNTLFYRDWANQVISFLRDENRINTHATWGRLRKFNLQNDYLFINEDKEFLFKQLFIHNPENKMALEYLLGLNLLNKDLNHFKENIQTGIKKRSYDKIPIIYQQALVYLENVVGSNADFSEYISSEVREQYENFQKSCSATVGNEGTIRRNFGNTYWYYLLFRGDPFIKANY